MGARQHELTGSCPWPACRCVMCVARTGGRWRRGPGWQGPRRAAAGGDGVVLLSNPGVSALSAHITARGMAALEYALAGLSASHGGKRQCRAYLVLPGDEGVLLQWDEGDVAEAAAVLAGAQELGLEVPAGGVRGVALPHRSLGAAKSGLYAEVRQVRYHT